MKLNLILLQTEVLDFVKQHEGNDLPELILKGSPFKSVSIQQIAQQIKGKQIAKTKFLTLYSNDLIIYPPQLNLEQSSSEVTANYKAQFINENDSIIDITGGMGVDTLAFAEKTKKVTYCEIKSEVFEYANHNLKMIDSNIQLQLTDGIKFLKESKTQYDWIYIDPARRNQHQKKVFKLEDSTPNILKYLGLFQSKSQRVLVKASPLLDLKYCISKIRNISEIHIVAVKNEVKEVLLLIDFFNTESSPVFKAVNLETKQSDFVSKLAFPDKTPAVSKPKTYLYEPNAALMKSQLFGEISSRYKLSALAKNTHLFTSDDLIDFPGRRFKIKSIFSPKSKNIKKNIPDLKSNVSCRNYPIKPEQVKTKYKLKDGGQYYTFFTTDFKNQKIVLLCDKI